MRRSIGTMWCVLASACATQVVPDEPNADRSPTYHADIAPLLRRECAGCHDPGGVAPLSLATYAEVAERADAIVRATRDRVMPPWPADASGACGTFVDQRWLSDAQIAMLAAWRDAGAPEGEPSTEPAPDEPEAAAFAPAVTLVSAEPYLVVPGPDEYRCFIVDPALPADRYITAIRVALDRADVVHHIQLFAADDAAAEAALDALEADDARPGYACGEDGVGASLRYVGVWAAGDLVRRWAAGSGILVRGGHRLVLQLHYHNHGNTPIADRTSVDLELASAVDAVGDIHHARNTALYLLPGRSSIDSVATHAFDIDAPAVARGARIHMHRLGVAGRLELIRGGSTTCLLSIPRWDFGWQLFYMFDEPVELLPGDEVRLTCRYDTRTRDTPVTWGLGTDDEMCIGYTYFTR